MISPMWCTSPRPTCLLVMLQMMPVADCTQGTRAGETAGGQTAGGRGSLLTAVLQSRRRTRCGVKERDTHKPQHA
jgi:hypothetical protein